MSAAWLSPQHRVKVIPLFDLRGSDLNGVLSDEVDAWREGLEWDFTPSAELVVRFVDMRCLGGFALLVDEVVAGYAYFVSEPHKGLIGDLFVRPRYRTSEREDRLLVAVIDALRRDESVTRIESQLMMLSDPLTRPLPYPHHVTVYDRMFMVRAGQGNSEPAAAPAATALLPWREDFCSRAALVIRDAYQGHVDSTINDQYQTASGARRFLDNIVLYPGCGRFYPAASFLAFDRESGAAQGVVLASRVAAHAGHITQLCIAQPWQGRGIGRALLQASLAQLAGAGCRTVTLTVTSSNWPAITLYEQLGFVLRRRFGAHIWTGLS